MVSRRDANDNDNNDGIEGQPPQQHDTPASPSVGLPVLAMLRAQASPNRRPAFNSQSASPPPEAEIQLANDADQSVEATSIFKQPETRPITEEQLINEVQGIYAGLVMVEKKCVEMDQQLLNSTNKLTNEQWGALIALHRTLLHEHHDFFLASQHPSSSERLRKLASKYAMPARMWRHGIHAFLELLRHQLPGSLDHMLSFIYIAYSMMALLMESVPSFVDTWIECLGDLARYRMAVEEIDLGDREIWAGVARYWYLIAADKSPNVGRIQHHLAVLARPRILEQLFFYTKSLVCVQPFLNTRESIVLLFNPLLDSPEGRHTKMIPSFVKAHATLFGRRSILSFLHYSREFLMQLSNQVGRAGGRWRDQGVHIASINFAALLEYGQADGVFMKSFMNTLEMSPESRIDTARKNWRDAKSLPQSQGNASDKKSEIIPRSIVHANFTSSLDTISYGSLLTCHTMSYILKQIGDKNVLPSVHVSLSFLWSLAQVPEAMRYVEADVPWCDLVTFLNTLNRQGVSEPRLDNDNFPISDGSGLPCHLPEDFTMRGQIWSQLYYPKGFFDEPILDNEERLLELPSIAVPRTTRCLWLGCRIASVRPFFFLGSSPILVILESYLPLVGSLDLLR